MENIGIDENCSMKNETMKCKIMVWQGVTDFIDGILNMSKQGSFQRTM